MRVKRPWSLLSSHGLVLVAIARQPDLTVMEIASRTGLSRGSVLRVLRQLQQARMLDVKRRGRRNAYRVNDATRFRHPILRDKRIGGLLAAVGESRGS